MQGEDQTGSYCAEGSMYSKKRGSNSKETEKHLAANLEQLKHQNYDNKGFITIEMKKILESVLILNYTNEECQLMAVEE